MGNIADLRSHWFTWARIFATGNLTSLSIGMVLGIFALNPIACAESVIDFQRDIAPILSQNCATCHNKVRAKGDFVVTDRELVKGYLESGDANNSSLWTDYLTAKPVSEDPKSMVMPPSGPLPGTTLAAIKLWIDEGATWPEGAIVIESSTEGDLQKLAADQARQSVLRRAFGAIGYFHPAVVHFPIALLVFGAGAAMLSYFTGSRASSIAFHCLLWGTVAAIIAAVMGWSFAEEKGFPAWNTIPDVSDYRDKLLIYRHRWLGVIVATGSALTLLVAFIARRYPNHSVRHVWRIAMLVLAGLVSLAGHQGGELVYGNIFERAIDRLLGE